MSFPESLQTAPTVLPIAAGTWEIDPSQSEARFRVRHLGVGHVSGTLPITEGTITVPAHRRTIGEVTVRLAASGFDTRNPRRDTEIRGPKFLDADNHPDVQFRATVLERNEQVWTLHGQLQVKDNAEALPLDVELGDLDHVDQVRVRATGTVDRTSVGLARLPKLVIGHTVTVTVSALFVRAR